MSFFNASASCGGYAPAPTSSTARRNRSHASTMGSSASTRARLSLTVGAMNVLSTSAHAVAYALIAFARRISSSSKSSSQNNKSSSASDPVGAASASVSAPSVFNSFRTSTTNLALRINRCDIARTASFGASTNDFDASHTLPTPTRTFFPRPSPSLAQHARTSAVVARAHVHARSTTSSR